MLENNTLDLPEPKPLPNSNKSVPYYFIGDGIFPLKKYFMKPFAKTQRLSIGERIFNYRLSRTRALIEMAFGILAAKWRILQTSMNFNIENTKIIVMALICLHNFIITHEVENNNESCKYLSDTETYELDDIECVPCNDNETGLEVREKLLNYFISPEGSLEWQWNKI